MIDICTVTYNNLNFLRIFVDFLFANTKDFKLYISDSGSTDKTPEYLSKLKEKYPDILTFRHTEDNSGWTKGINWGVSQGSSPYVLITNYDLILPEKWFEKMSAHLKEGVGAVGPVSDIVAGRQDFHYSYGQYEDEVELLIGFCLLTKREILDKVGLLDEFYFYGHDDYDFSIRLRDAGYKLIIARDVFVKHFCYQSLSQIETSNPKLLIDNRNYTIKKHGQEKYNKTAAVKPTVVAGIPFHGDVDNEFVSSLLTLEQPKGAGALIFSKTVRTLISPARNLLAKTALDRDSEFLLFIDSDMVFGRESLIRLLSRACDKNISIIGGLCYNRRTPFKPCIFMRNKNNWEFCKVTDPPGLYEVDAIGMGFTLIRTEVFKSLTKLPKRPSKKPKKPDLPYQYFYPDKEGMREDLNFCLNAKKAGHRIFVDTTVQVGHLGERVVIDHHLKSFNEEVKKGIFIQ